VQSPRMLEPRRVADQTWLLAFTIPIPGLGVLPGNAFVIRSREPVLVDTGMAALRDDFLAALSRVIDPAELRWIYVTHMDLDHVGSLAAVLERAPRARVVTTFLGMAKMGLLGLPQERAYLLNPGQALDVGDRRLHALRPPTFDAPETTGLFDERSRALFCADSFGAVQSELVDDAAQIAPAALREGMHVWSSIDAPWLALADRARLGAALERVRALQPEIVLSSHLQPARGMTDRLIASLADTAGLAPFVGPDQAALEQMMGALAEAA
jgi:flavorubredoxin